jgi:hypothetical protein
MQWLADLLTSLWDKVVELNTWLAEQMLQVMWDGLTYQLIQLQRLVAYLFGQIWAMWGDAVKALAYKEAVEIGHFLEMVPVPQALADLPSNWAAVPWGQMGFWLGPFEVGYGATVIIGAQVTKLVLRWIPVVGAAFRAPSN